MGETGIRRLLYIINQNHINTANSKDKAKLSYSSIKANLYNIYINTVSAEESRFGVPAEPESQRLVAREPPSGRRTEVRPAREWLKVGSSSCHLRPLEGQAGKEGRRIFLCHVWSAF